MAAEIGQVVIECGINILYVESFHIVQRVNEHATAEFAAVLKEADGKGAMSKFSQDTEVKIFYLVQDGSNETKVSIFEGIPLKIRVSCQNCLYSLNMELVSSTYRMDVQKKNRSFQDTRLTYLNIIKQLIHDEYEGQYIQTANAHVTIGHPYIQYEETDWAFLKRLVSRLGSFLIPNMSGGKIQIYIGFPARSTQELTSDDYESVNDVAEYQKALCTGDKVSGEAFYSYKVYTEKNLGLCDVVMFRDETYVIWKKEVFWREQALRFCYTLKKKDAWTQVTLWNENLTGASLEGEILEVKGNKMRVHLYIDEKQDKDKAYWYSYVTPYSSNQQVGFYAMPEEGGSVLLYIPGRSEESARLITSKRGDGDSNSKTSDPDTKYMDTAEGKSIMLSGDTLSIDPVEGISIKMTDSDGIAISSNNDLSIVSEKEITFSGDSIEFSGTDGFEIVTQDGTISINDEIEVYSSSGVQQNVG